MSKPQHPTSRELKQKALGDLYSPESRESDLNSAVRRAFINDTRDRNWMVTKSRKRCGKRSGASGHLTEHTEALIEDSVRTISAATA